MLNLRGIVNIDQRRDGASDQVQGKSNLFVLGCPRSGTTGLTHILNGHHDAIVGYEVFANIYASNFELFVDGIFESERFVDALCHLAAGPDGPKWSVVHPSRVKTARLVEAVRVLGDKVPSYYRRLSELAERFPRARFLVIYRGRLIPR